MAKAKYNPLNAFREDPLAALKRATESEHERADNGNSAFAQVSDSGQVVRERTETAPSEPQRPSAESAPISKAATKPLAPTLNTSRNTVYLYPEDLTKLRQLSGYVSSEHGIRANDSMIFRAALALLEPDVRLLHALRETEMLDRRRKARAS